MSSILIKNGLIATFGTDNKIINDHAIYIEEGVIKHIIPQNLITDIYKYAKVIDAKGKLVMPGMINTHMHLYSTFARGSALKGAPPRNFAEILEKLWWRLDKSLSAEDLHYSALIPLIGAIKCGTTTLIDHHASPHNVKNSLDIISKAYNTLGLRGVLAYEVSDRDGIEIANEGIEENIRFIEKHRKDDMIKGMFGLHAMFTLSDRTLSFVSEEVERLNTGVHIHVAEDRYDKDYNIAHYKLSPVQRLDKYGLAKPNSIFIHCIHIDEQDQNILKNTDTMVVHNPQSNMNNAVGCCDLISIMEKGIMTGLGTDGMTFNMFEELGIANVIHKHVRQTPNTGWGEVETLITKNNPEIASRIFGKKIGVIEPEAAGDVIILDYDPPTPLNSSNFWGHMLFGITKSKVLTTIVNGQVLMEDGNLTIDGIDEADINKKSREIAEKFWERFEN
jgi:putative selenium metabolism protein SsnA